MFFFIFYMTSTLFMQGDYLYIYIKKYCINKVMTAIIAFLFLD